MRLLEAYSLPHIYAARLHTAAVRRKPPDGAPGETKRTRAGQGVSWYPRFPSVVEEALFLFHGELNARSLRMHLEQSKLSHRNINIFVSD